MSYSILIVDDSDIIRAMVARTLKLTKLPIQSMYEAQNGALALDILKNEWIDILFTDLNMPVLNGFELINTMKKAVELNDIPIVVITTEGNTNRLDELKRIGVNSYLRKPFTPEQIRDTITTLLGVWNGK